MIKVTFYGYSSFALEGEKVKLLVDTGVKIPGEETIIPQDSWPNTDIILVTSVSEDHSGKAKDVLETSSHAFIVAPPELQAHLGEGEYNFQPARAGESYNLLGCRFQAFSAIPGQAGGGLLTSLFKRKGETKEGLGYLIEMEERTICNLGETLFREDWEEWQPDLLLVPIGGGTTMDSIEALKAIDKIKPRLVVPMHYNLPSGVYKASQVNTDDFSRVLTEKGFDCRVLLPGESIVI